MFFTKTGTLIIRRKSHRWSESWKHPVTCLTQINKWLIFSSPFKYTGTKTTVYKIGNKGYKKMHEQRK